jgi:adenylate kinase family enzyme
MRRVLVIGSPGSGKTTFSTRLAAKLAVPVHYLDLQHWAPGWRYREATEARERVRLLTEMPQWVMDGNFAETFDLRMPRADTLIWLDYSRVTCLRRILARTIKDYGTQKPDLPEGCPEKFDAGLLRFTWRFPKESRPQIVAGLERFGGHLHIFRLCSDRDVAAFARTQGLA